MQPRYRLLTLSCVALIAVSVSCSTASKSDTDGQVDVQAEERPQQSGEEDETSESSDASKMDSEEPEPLLDSQVLPVADSPVFGDPDAPMTIVVFPADNHATIPKLQKVVEAYEGEVRLVSKHLSASALQNGATPGEVLEADLASVREDRMALVLEALHRQDSKVYWSATRALTAARPNFDEHPPEEVGAELAQEYGLDVDQYRDDLEDPATAEAVARDTKLAKSLGITGRSTVVFNGEKIGGMRLELHSIVDLVERHFDVLEKLRKNGVEESRLYRAAVDREVLEDETLPEVERTPWKLADWNLPDIRRVELRDDDPARGPENAPVTIVEITELEDCYVCSLQRAALDHSLKEYSDETRVIFKYSPRAHESSSRTLAAAHRQERFWDAYSMLIDSDRHQYPPKKVSAEAVADELGLETERFQQDLRADETAEMIEQSVDDVRGAGVRVVPSLIVNGLELYDPGPRQLKAVVEKQLEIARQLRDQEGLSGEELHAALIEYNEENTEDVWLVR